METSEIRLGTRRSGVVIPGDGVASVGSGGYCRGADGAALSIQEWEQPGNWDRYGVEITRN